MENTLAQTEVAMGSDFNTLPSPVRLEKTVENLKAHGFEPIMAHTGAEAFEKIKELIPAGASVMNGSSATLQQIGFIDYLKGGAHGWNNLHDAILAEKDPVKQALLRKQSVVSDYFLSSVQAITEDGQIVVTNATGSSFPSLSYTSQNIILVVSTKKIMTTLEDAMARIREHVFPLEDKRMKDLGADGSVLAKWLIMEREAAFMGRKVYVILVGEDLGF